MSEEHGDGGLQFSGVAHTRRGLLGIAAALALPSTGVMAARRTRNRKHRRSTGADISAAAAAVQRSEQRWPLSGTQIEACGQLAVVTEGELVLTIHSVSNPRGRQQGTLRQHYQGVKLIDGNGNRYVMHEVFTASQNVDFSSETGGPNTFQLTDQLVMIRLGEDGSHADDWVAGANLHVTIASTGTMTVDRTEFWSECH